ncbi:MAG TPA: hypothetical protein VEA59_03505, partial [Patescibacteria group bacterium]|nr:hypothetical protein [Patescibacteria group bacterium]
NSIPSAFADELGRYKVEGEFFEMWTELLEQVLQRCREEWAENRHMLPPQEERDPWPIVTCISTAHRISELTIKPSDEDFAIFTKSWNKAYSQVMGLISEMLMRLY